VNSWIYFQNKIDLMRTRQENIKHRYSPELLRPKINPGKEFAAFERQIEAPLFPSQVLFL
jgi:hypothetical protein